MVFALRTNGFLTLCILNMLCILHHRVIAHATTQMYLACCPSIYSLEMF